MRDDIYIEEVLSKCDVLKRSRMWLGEPRMRPRSWLRNFDETDRFTAAKLLDGFVFFDQRMTESLLKSAFFALGDGRAKDRQNRSRSLLVNSLNTAVFTPVLGENPDPTDSGNFLCRLTRQLLFPGSTSVSFDEALDQAYAGNPVIFVDDIIGSGDQFLSTWDRKDGSQRSFQEAERIHGFLPIYVALVSTRSGLDRIRSEAPAVSVSVTHVVENRSTLDGIFPVGSADRSNIETFLEKYSSQLRPREVYIKNNHDYIKYGYKNRKLMLAFEHSVPDATLPIFWSPGRENWRPLIERA